MNKIFIPPIKSQGIKTKLVDWINELVIKADLSSEATWYEPFFGTGVVGFNVPNINNYIVGDTNPHIINFYQGVQRGEINDTKMRLYLEDQGHILNMADEDGYVYYREVVARFNEHHSPYDFIFLSRAGFNGMMRFNRKGNWNIPFCKKPNRFAPPYITKICNQIRNIEEIISSKKWMFINTSFREIIEQASEKDIIYCDPPYLGRYVDYYNGWTENEERELFELLSKTKAKFILSTWHHNQYRENEMINKYWNNFNILTHDHFYHSGAKIENRKPMVEALIFNFEPIDIPLSLDMSEI